MSFKIGYKTISRVGCTCLTLIYRGLLGAERQENAAILVDEIRNALANHEADVAVLSFVRTDSAMYRYAAELATGGSRPRCGEPQGHWSITLAGTFEEFLQRLPAKVRRNRRQEASKLLRAHSGVVKVECFSALSDVQRIVEDVEAIAATTYHRGLGVGFVPNEEMQRRLSMEAQAGRLRAYILYVSGRPWAFMLGTLYEGVFFGDFMGYDPAHRAYSPGTFLLLRIIEDLCAVGAKGVDFGFGDAWYKEQFGECKWQESSIYMFARTFAGLRLLMLQDMTSLINRMAVKVLTQSKLIQRAKRMWRGLYTGHRETDPAQKG